LIRVCVNNTVSPVIVADNHRSVKIAIALESPFTNRWF